MARLAALAAAGALIAWPASSLAGAAGECWRTPAPKTFEELGVTIANEQKRQEKTALPEASLALSDPSTPLKAAYGAGLLVGWSETGKRPAFSIVSAVGMSALIAPFAFLGVEGDSKIADMFTCEAANAEAIAKRAVAGLDAETLEKIARRHEAGARLVVALPGSAARSETIWDLGAIAASRHPEARRHIESILLAAVDLATFVDPAAVSLGAGAMVGRNNALREVGAGEPFLSIDRGLLPSARSYLIHNGVMYPDEGERYMMARDADGDVRAGQPSVVSAYDFFIAARLYGTEAIIASPRPRMNIAQPSAAFDMSYLRALFLDTYRQARMGREWRRTFTDRNSSRHYGP